MKFEKKDFREAVEMLADRVGIEIPSDRKIDTAALERAALLAKANQRAMEFYQRFLLEKKESQVARHYLENRGLKAETIANFKLGYAPESWDALLKTLKVDFPEKVLERSGLLIEKKEGGYYDRFRQRVIFPILDAKGVCVAFGARVIGDALPKYLNSPETEIYSKGRNLYGLFQARQAIRENDAAIVVEGYLDVISCHQAGVCHAVASLGTALTPDQARLIKRHTKNVFMLYDADKAGELATLRGLEIFLEEGMDVKVVRLSEGHDPDSFIREQGVERFREALAKAQTLFDYKLALLKEKFESRSTEGKVKIAQEMALLFSKVSNEILKSAWTQALARELSLSEEALAAETEKNKVRAQSPRVLVGSEPVIRNEASPAERLLLGLLLENPKWLVRAREEIGLEDFQNLVARRIYAKLLDAGSEPVTIGQALNAWQEDAEASGLISAVWAQLDRVPEKEKTFSDCVWQLKRFRIKTQRSQLMSEMALAEQTGDQNQVNQFMVSLHELNQREKKINEKK